MDAFLFLAEGFEETEAITTVDLLRRAAVSVAMVSMSDTPEVTGAHGVRVSADLLFDAAAREADGQSGVKMLILPGGPGHAVLKQHQGLAALLRRHAEAGGYLAAICAAPAILGGLNLLAGKRAVCYPGFEPQLIGATVTQEPVVTDGRVITSKGPGTTPAFALAIITALKGAETAARVGAAFIL